MRFTGGIPERALLDKLVKVDCNVRQRCCRVQLVDTGLSRVATVDVCSILSLASRVGCRMDTGAEIQGPSIVAHFLNSTYRNGKIGQ